MLRFTKIKRGKDKYTFEYTYEKEDGKSDEYTFSSPDKPRPKFMSLFDELKPFVIELCELPKKYESRIDVRGVSLNYSGEKKVMGAVITAMMKLEESNPRLVLNTPFKIEMFHAEHGDSKQLLPDGCAAIIYDMMKRAKEYIEGDREQMEIFKDVNNEEEETHEAEEA